MHQLCARTKYSRFHGTNVESDFVEAPSQMLENWTWDLKSLQNLSSHYQRKDEKIPAELVDSLIKSKNVNVALNNLRQIFFGIFDMSVHTAKTIGIGPPDYKQ